MDSGRKVGGGMRLVGDISAFQSHNEEWTAWQPIDLAAYARSVDASWVRWTDWSGYLKWGPDPGYNHLLEQIQANGKPAGPYLFPRPGRSDPVTQVATWHAATPAISWSPMLDPESNDGLSGPAFSQWVDVALAEMTQRWQRIPWLYAAASTVQKFGWTRPTTPHLLILAEYHWGYTPFSWGDRGGWEQRAYSKYGGPDLPWGLGGTDAWQFTSSAEVPGMAGLIDCSWVTDGAFVTSSGGGGAVSVPGLDDGFTPQHGEQLAVIHRAFVG